MSLVQEKSCLTVPGFHASSLTCRKAIEIAQQYDSPLLISICLPKGDMLPQNQADSHGMSLALYVHQLALHYGVVVILHSQHCIKLLPWLDGLLQADRDHYKKHGVPLFSSHGIDLSQDPHWDDNRAICSKYFADYCVPMDLWLEMTVGHSSKMGQHISLSHACLSRLGRYFSISVPRNIQEEDGLLDELIRVQAPMADNNLIASLFVMVRSTHSVHLVSPKKALKSTECIPFDAKWSARLVL